MQGGPPVDQPVYIKGARPGDLLEIEYLDILPQPHGWTRNRPGADFLRDLFTEPYLAHWDIKDGWATSPQTRSAYPQWLIHGHHRHCSLTRPTRGLVAP